MPKLYVPKQTSTVVMGVSGCGKSSLGAALAREAGLPLIEGDDFHSAESVSKMRAGIALTDADRAGWLAALGAELARRPDGPDHAGRRHARHQRQADGNQRDDDEQIGRAHV